MMRLLHLSPTYKALWTIALVSLLVFFVGGKWKKGRVVEGDVVSYYSYLPAVVIHGDISMHYALGNDFFADKVWGPIWKAGVGSVQKYTMGLSWLYAPFFLVGHASAYILGYPPDGYSTPYQFFLQLSAIAYLLLGLGWLRKLLLRWHSEEVTALCLLVLALGTNLFYYSSGHGAMPHVYLFALASGLLWFSLRFYEAPSWGLGLLVGLLGSLIVMVRPIHLLYWLVPVACGLVDGDSLRGRWLFWRQHWPKLLAWAAIQGLLVLPQLWYWHLLTDRWIYYSYQDEHFFWGQPKLLSLMFSFRNGWLIYTPVMALGLLGLGLLRRKAQPYALVAPVLVGLGLYVASAWWCWWYGGSFGQRALIDYFPLLALGLAALFSRAAAWGRTWRRIGLGGLAFFIVLNLFQTFQFTRGIIHYDSMTAAAYLHSFGRDRVGREYLQYLQAPDYEAAKVGER